MTQLFVSGGRSIGVSASTSVLLMNFQDRFPLGWTGWISLQSKGLSRVFSNTTVLLNMHIFPLFGLPALKAIFCLLATTMRHLQVFPCALLLSSLLHVSYFLFSSHLIFLMILLLLFVPWF